MNNGEPITWVEHPCNGCGTKDGQFFFEGPDLLMGLPGRFRLVTCPTCGLIRQNPHPDWESLSKYYPEDYRPYTKIIDQEKQASRRMDRRYGMWKRVKAVEQFQSSGRLLDVGCGTGVFLGEAKRASNWELKGIEPNPEAAAYAQEILKIPIFVERLENANLPHNYFDVITMWNVLEHLETPITSLQHVYQLLKPGGWLVFSIPNVDSLSAKVFGPYWMGWDLPRHLYLFPQAILREQIEAIGFNWINIDCIAGGHSSLTLSIRFLFRAKNIDNLATRTTLRIYNSIPARVALMPFFWIADKLRQCSLITIFAQKKPGITSHDREIS